MGLKNQFLDQEQINQLLEEHYGITAVTINKVEGGADPNAKVFSVEDPNKRVYFVKVLKEFFSSTGVSITYYFNQNGINKVIAPILTLTGKMWVKNQSFALIVFPFIHGKNGYQKDFTCQQWVLYY